MAINGNHPKQRPTKHGCKCFHCIGGLAEGRHRFKGAAKVNVATRRAVEAAGAAADPLAVVEALEDAEDERFGCGARPWPMDGDDDRAYDLWWEGLTPNQQDAWVRERGGWFLFCPLQMLAPPAGY